MPSARPAALLPFPLVLLLARAAGWVSRALGRGRGTSLPGLLATRLDPHVLSRLVAGLRDGVVVVTGTNGKTSTCHLLRAALSTGGAKVVGNDAGSNLSQGVITALIRGCDLWGRPVAGLAVLEVDEAAFGRLASQLSPRLVVVLNLFRDQLDRHAELDTLVNAIGSALAATTADVLLNADDARVAALASHARGRVAFFGLDRPVDDGAGSVAAGDVSPCPRCGEQLRYRWVAYAQLGRYECRSCGLERPHPSVAMTGAQHGLDDRWRIWVRAGAQHLQAETSLRGAYNQYNLVAAVAAARWLGADAQDALDAAAGCGAVRGRGAATIVGDGEIVLLLGKNPTGVAQVLDTYIRPEASAPLLLVLNDAASDGRDVSWIWDAPLESLARRPGPVLVAGSRAESMLVRLRYAETPAQAYGSVDAALDELAALVRHGGRAFVLTTYSAVQTIDDRLSRLHGPPREVSTAA